MDMMRWIANTFFLAASVAIGLAAALAMSSPPAGPDLRVSVEQLEGASMRVVYEWRKPRREMIFRSVPGGYRERRWEIETEGLLLRRGAEEDFIFHEDGRRFDRVVLVAMPDIIRLPKEYPPVAVYGEGGALVYTGHFWPVGERGARINATFSFTPAPGGAATAFGEHAPALSDWRSPMAHPAFVYMGPLVPETTAHMSALVDPAAPEWIRREFHEVAARAFDYFAETFGGGPETKPNLFLTVALRGDPGRLRFSGDALPGQFQVTLQGGGWRASSPRGLDIFRQSVIHEAFHLWQSASARPGDEGSAGWIHEGGADIVAAEAMVALGYWDAGALTQFSQRARRECAHGIEDGPLAVAHLRGDFRALYGCGVVIAEAVARADGGTATDFWRDFMAAAERRGGYSADFFEDFVAGRTGRDFAESVRYFVETPHARPERDIDRLGEAARKTAGGAAPLASGDGR